MEKIAGFEKVSRERFVKDFLKTFPNMSPEQANESYDAITLPVRATKGSAGYDLRTTLDFTVRPGEEIMIPTGIRAYMREDYCLFVFPRSGLGFKFRFQLDNSIGVVDSDYYYTENEGHIFVKMINDSREGKDLSLKRGDAFAQGIFMSYGVTFDDCSTTERKGGMGSTDNEQKN